MQVNVSNSIQIAVQAIIVLVPATICDPCNVRIRGAKPNGAAYGGRIGLCGLIGVLILKSDDQERCAFSSRKVLCFKARYGVCAGLGISSAVNR